jgi:DNA invertase Pin-like site-specific DNA recombinase
MSEHHSTNGITRAVSYYRMSDAKQEASIPEQREWAHRAAPRHGFELLREFEDQGIPGDEIARRKGLQSLLDYCAAEFAKGRPVEAVVCWDADRFSRANSFTTAAVLDRLMGCGVRSMLTREGRVDFEDDMQRVFFNLRQDLGKRAYSKSVSAAVSRARASRAREGLWTGGAPPFAYVRGPDGHLAFGDPTDVETVRWIFEQYLTRDVGEIRLAGELQKMGRPYPARKNRRGWSGDLVHCILTDPHYTGDLYYNRTSAGKYSRTLPTGEAVEHRPGKTPGGNLKRVYNDAAEFIVSEEAHPAIIGRQDFERVQRKLEARRTRSGPRAGKADYPFSGLARCGECGAVMHGITAVKKVGGKRWAWKKYICSSYQFQGLASGCHHNTVMESDLIDRAAAVLEGHFARPGALEEVEAAVEARWRERTRAALKDAGKLRKQAAELDANIARGTRNLALARTPKDFERVSAALAGWEAERDALAAELREAEEEAAAEGRQRAELQKALGALREIGAVLREAPPDRLGEVARAMIERVELDFEHRTTPKGRVWSTCTGGRIVLRDDLGVSRVTEFRLRNSASTSRQRRVSPRRRSTGW